MNLRTMTIGDYEEVYALWTSTPGMGLNSIDDRREGIEKYLSRNPHTSFVAEEGGRILGVILGGHDGRRGFIYHLAVGLPDRGRGLGRRLVEACLDALRREGIAKVALVVMGDNAIGNAFWERLDFGTRPDLVYRNRVIALEEMRAIDVR